ncbi:MAG: hypothetical protein O2799_04505, partial [Planctomycetota bacterium]|nr:hypothetical protein [Planctomycetota bacterium]
MARSVRSLLPVLLAGFLVLLGSAWLRGALASGVGAQDDEPAHFVTAIMVRDWLLSGAYADPVGYARTYYAHLPKVAIGQWPPVLYGALGLWMVVFGVGTASAVAFVCAVGAALLALVSRAACGLGLPPWGPVALLIALPLVQRLSGMVMTELPLALGCTAAVLAGARLLQRGDLRSSLAFGLWAVVAILTKGNALALAAVPALGVLLTGRFELLRRPAFWLPAVLVLGLCAPWYLFTTGYQASSWDGGATPHWAYTASATPIYLRGLVADLGGMGVALLALAGLLLPTRSAALEPDGAQQELEDTRRAFRAASGAFLVGLLLLLVILPSSPLTRHLCLIAPCWALLAGLGAEALGRRLGGGPLPWLGLAAVAFLAGPFEVVRKDELGATPLLAPLCAEAPDARVLVASDAIGEGLVIGGLAALEGGPRPRRFVLRASRFLITDDWNGRQYTNHYPTLPALQARLDDASVALLALDASMPPERWFEHHRLLRELVEAEGSGWTRVAVGDAVRAGVRHAEALEVWERDGWRSLPAHPIVYEPERAPEQG